MKDDQAPVFLIGQWVTFQTHYGALAEGEVVDYVPDIGLVTIRNDDDDIWEGLDDCVFHASERET